MTPRILCFVLGLTVWLTGCSEEPAGPAEGRWAEPPERDLSIVVPELTSAVFVAEVDGGRSSQAESARTDERDDELYEPGEAPSGIYDARTVPGFEPGYAYARGQNWYSGNKGRIETTADVSFQNESIGSQTAFSEGYELFLLDFGRWKFLSATARVYSGHECGLSISGRSEHTAWWEFFTGTGVATWGKTALTTAAAPVSQEACTPFVGSGDWGSGGSSTFACWYLLTYDLDTGAVYDAELLYCDEVAEVE